MPRALWVGGPPAAGKTTVARRLARRRGLRLYSADTRTWAHRDRALAAGSLPARRWEALSPRERLASWSPTEMLEMSLHHERGPMVIDDLQALPSTPMVVAEGTVLPAWALSSGVVDRSRTVWLLPTPEFQRRRLAATGVPGGAVRLYMQLRSVIEKEALEHGAPTLVVDGSRGVIEVAQEVERRFGEALAEGPCAATAAERKDLLRETNMAVVAQVRGYFARPWANGDPDLTERLFVCECGDRNCDEDILSTVAVVAAGPVFAPDHEGE